MRKSLLLAAVLIGGACLTDALAQISTNPNKFLGNITTTYQMDTDGYIYADLWNQVTPENETKWASVEGNRGSFNWGGADNAYNYAKNHGLAFKFHCFAWGSQYPSWIESLSAKERYKAIVEWMDAAKAHYPDLQLIDVVNEAIPGHQQGTHFFEEALGGAGTSGYDWIVKAFELAYERWPNAILIYNDFNTFQWNTDEYIRLVQALIDAGAPIDAYGCQSHDLGDMSGANLKTVMTKIQNALKIPMYISEYDIDKQKDSDQELRYKEQIPLMWEADYCAGVTIWGFIQGKTWEDYSGISYGKGNERPAMKWLREYMKSDKAKNAGFRANFPFTNGWTKEASVYVKPTTTKASKGDPIQVEVRASMRTKTIDHVELYAGTKLMFSKTEGPFVADYLPEKEGTVEFKAIVYTTDGCEYTRSSHVTTYPPRKPYMDKVADIPGTLQLENFDTGADGISFHDTDDRDEGGTGYRKDKSGVDIVTGNKGYAIGYTSSGEWLEYTVDVKESGTYLFTAYASSGADGSGFSIGIWQNGELTDLASVAVPKTGDGNWDKYVAIDGRCAVDLEAGRNIVRVTVTGSSCNMDRIEFIKLERTDKVKLNVEAEPEIVIAGDPVAITVTADITPDTLENGKRESVTVKRVDLYINDKLVASGTGVPFRYLFEETNTAGTYRISTMAVDSKRRESYYYYGEFQAQKARRAYDGPISIPGSLQFEDFDVQGEGLTFHDSDAVDEGGYAYRKDNEGVDIISSGKNFLVASTAEGEWMEYTVNVKSDGYYKFDAKVGSDVEGSAFSISLNEDGTLIPLAEVTVPLTEGTTKISGGLSEPLTAGQHFLRVTILKGGCTLDMLKFSADTGVEKTEDDKVYAVYSVSGICLGQIECSDENIDEAVVRLTGNTGMFLLKDIASGNAERRYVK